MELNSKAVALRFMEFSVKLKKTMKNIVHHNDCCTITEQQFRTLIVLSRLEKAMLKELSLEMIVSSSSLCIMLNRLFDQGLINRNIDAEDRRNTIYSLTPKGQEVLKSEIERKVEYMSKYIDRLDISDREKLIKCTEEIERILLKLL